jgi:hypothetical protein
MRENSVLSHGADRTNRAGFVRKKTLKGCDACNRNAVDDVFSGFSHTSFRRQDFFAKPVIHFISRHHFPDRPYR